MCQTLFGCIVALLLCVTPRLLPLTHATCHHEAKRTSLCLYYCFWLLAIANLHLVCSGVYAVLLLWLFPLQLLPRCTKEQVMGQIKDLMASLLKVSH